MSTLEGPHRVFLVERQECFCIHSIPEPVSADETLGIGD
jgi:hypothetical protein